MTQQHLMNSTASAPVMVAAPVLVGGSTVDEFCARWRISRTTFYEEVKDKKLILRKIRGRSVVTSDDEAAWLKALPVVEPAAA